ncbi:hypothetical protein BDW75DRAFT_239964 [Aspergillus navahoensis]
MVGVQIHPQPPTWDTDLLDAARARTLPPLSDRGSRSRTRPIRIHNNVSAETSNSHRILALPDITDHNGEPLLDNVKTLETNGEDATSDNEAREEFESVEKWHSSLQNPTLAHWVHYAQAERDYEIQEQISVAEATSGRGVGGATERAGWEELAGTRASTGAG